MSKNVKVNGVNYTGVSQVQLPTTAGGTALFKDVDEITTPSGSINITENGTHNVSAYAQAVVNVASGGGEDDTEVLLASFRAVVDGTRGGIVLPAGLTKITNVVTGVNLRSVTIPDSVTVFDTACFKNSTNLVEINIPQNLEIIANEVFWGCGNLVMAMVLPATVDSVGQYAFYTCGVKTVTFMGTPSSIHTGAFNSSMTINVPWAEGEVAGAPWGAGRVNYNYTGA